VKVFSRRRRLHKITRGKKKCKNNQRVCETKQNKSPENPLPPFRFESDPEERREEKSEPKRLGSTTPKLPLP